MKLAFIIFFISSLAQAALPLLKVRTYNRVMDAKKITLLDVVDKKDLTEESERKLAAVVLGDAPQVGEQRVYTNTAIAAAVRGSALNNHWSLQIPHKVTIDNKGYQIDQVSLEAEIISKWKNICSECEFKIKQMNLPALPTSLAGLPWELEISEKLPRGAFSEKIIVRTADGRLQNYFVNGQMEVKKIVPVLMRSTPMKTRLTEEDFKFQLRDVTYATDTAPTAQEIVGQQARYTMNANDIIWRGSLLREKAVQRGEIVKVFVEDSAWQVSMQVRSEQDGFVGDTINLRNLQSNKMITGRIVGSGEVEIR